MNQNHQQNGQSAKCINGNDALLGAHGAHSTALIYVFHSVSEDLQPLAFPTVHPVGIGRCMSSVFGMKPSRINRLRVRHEAEHKSRASQMPAMLRMLPFGLNG